MSRAKPYAEHVKAARGQLRRLATIERHLLEMSESWGELDTWVMSLLELQANQIRDLSKELAASVGDWQFGSEREEN